MTEERHILLIRVQENIMEKEINLGDVIKYLSRAFAKATSKASNSVNTRALRVMNKRTGQWENTLLYEYQVDFCYLMDNIKRGPRYISTKSIQRANELIAELEAEAS